MTYAQIAKESGQEHPKNMRLRLKDDQEALRLVRNFTSKPAVAFKRIYIHLNASIALKLQTNSPK